MMQSMTAFASRTGSNAQGTWMWELRSVNARGLDLRLRLPDGTAALEEAVRKALSTALKRGNVSLSLRITHDSADPTLGVDSAQLDRVLTALDTIQERAFAMGVTLGQPTAADVLNQRGVLQQGGPHELSEDTISALMSDIAPLVADLVGMRAREGAALADIIGAQLDEIADLVSAAQGAAIARQPIAAEAVRAAMQRVLGETDDVDPDRALQEIAALAIKTDVTEEIDRLKSHVSVARELLETADKQPIGRKLDFLTQEFNREANTLCAKAQYPALTGIGLDLKTKIDQMREQIQNVE